MKDHEYAFLAAVLVCALVFAAVSFDHARTHFASAPAAQAGVAGRPRDLDIGQIKRLIEQGELSGHEAQFYTSTPAQSAAPARP